MGVSYNRFLDRLDRVDSRRGGRIHESSRGYGRSRIYESQGIKLDMGSLLHDEKDERGHIEKEVKEIFEEIVDVGMKWIKDVTHEKSGSYKINKVLRIEPNTAIFDIKNSGMQIENIDFNALIHKGGRLKWLTYIGDMHANSNALGDVKNSLCKVLRRHLEKMTHMKMKDHEYSLPILDIFDDESAICLKIYDIDPGETRVVVSLYRE